MFSEIGVMTCLRYDGFGGMGYLQYLEERTLGFDSNLKGPSG